MFVVSCETVTINVSVDGAVRWVVHWSGGVWKCHAEKRMN